MGDGADMLGREEICSDDVDLHGYTHTAWKWIQEKAFSECRTKKTGKNKSWQIQASRPGCISTTEGHRSRRRSANMLTRVVVHSTNNTCCRELKALVIWVLFVFKFKRKMIVGTGSSTGTAAEIGTQGNLEAIGVIIWEAFGPVIRIWSCAGNGGRRWGAIFAAVVHRDCQWFFFSYLACSVLVNQKSKFTGAGNGDGQQEAQNEGNRKASHKYLVKTMEVVVEVHACVHSCGCGWWLWLWLWLCGFCGRRNLENVT